MAQTIGLTSYSVSFHSYSEPNLAADNELVRNILLAVLSSLAKEEPQKISERTKAGMARAKAKTVKIGRRRLENRHEDRENVGIERGGVRRINIGEFGRRLLS
jgi:DNA invertase Pin-like site-specific DNA recombinase